MKSVYKNTRLSKSLRFMGAVTYTQETLSLAMEHNT